MLGVLFFCANEEEENKSIEEFQDVELKFDIWGEMMVKYEGYFTLSVAQPIGHDKYKDTRVIVFSSWVF